MWVSQNTLKEGFLRITKIY